MNTQYLTLCFVLTLLSHLALAMTSKLIPAMYVFGDSLVDSGNNNHLPIFSRAKYLPYGIDFGGKPTGRCTNGKTVVDYLAIHLGLPFVPPYLGLSKHQRNRITTGINYASAGSGILPETNNRTSLSLDDQIKFFKKTVKHNLPKQYTEKHQLEKHLSESLFFVSTGVNDYFPNGTFRGNSKLASLLLNDIFLRLQRMYSLGARRFFINNIPPAGCFPSKAVHTRPRGICVEKFNRAITSYNRRLPQILHELQSKLPGFTFIHSDLNRFLIELRKTAENYGIVETWKPCCPNTIYGDLICGPNVIPCPNRNTHLFFDDHPSQISNQIYTIRCLNEATICKPSGLKLF
ncbi:GDSL esterase/lipase At2g03980-like [Abrus precatorius]|uniref:GDSL esterase/lipase At2g03980-like n=1 Tax=Abrus precatorius TaxID=3816 RepID=A0A8B8M4G0_ABRPR|nr:GDSL esterase/lipase At2g03980-like [Abrus precatorius]